MDERLAALDRRIAEAADAWMSDPRDVGVYTRLIEAIGARRAYLNPTLDETVPARSPAPAVDPITVAPSQAQPEEVLDDLGAAHPARQILAELGEDPRALLERLRGAN